MNSISVRRLTEADARAITAVEIAQGWGAEGRLEKYLSHLKDMQEGRCIALAADFGGKTAGYINLYFEAACGPYAGTGMPEIVDFGVPEKFRRLGIGTALMDEAERLAAEICDSVCLAVGLHCGYGSAQRMYAKRGYIPDGSGAWYGSAPAEPYGSTCLDDDLVIYLAKKLR